MDWVAGVFVFVGCGYCNCTRVCYDNFDIFGVYGWAQRDFIAEYCTGVLFYILDESPLCYAGGFSIVVRGGVWTGLGVFRCKTKNATQ